MLFVLKKRRFPKNSFYFETFKNDKASLERRLV